PAASKRGGGQASRQGTQTGQQAGSQAGKPAKRMCRQGGNLDAMHFCRFCEDTQGGEALMTVASMNIGASTDQMFSRNRDEFNLHIATALALLGCNGTSKPDVLRLQECSDAHLAYVLAILPDYKEVSNADNIRTLVLMQVQVISVKYQRLFPGAVSKFKSWRTWHQLVLKIPLKTALASTQGPSMAVREGIFVVNNVHFIDGTRDHKIPGSAADKLRFKVLALLQVFTSTAIACRDSGSVGHVIIGDFNMTEGQILNTARDLSADVSMIYGAGEKTRDFAFSDRKVQRDMSRRPKAWDNMHYGLHITLLSEDEQWWSCQASRLSTPRSPFDVGQ
ncbi:MAG: hypothetical protein ACR2IY_01790, partial [Rubrivivax sp.]